MEIQTSAGMLDLTHPHVMGILNVTPDSFSDGGNYVALDKALAHAGSMMKMGASIIDVGGESTRPGATDVSLEEELKRVIPVIKAIRKKYPEICISVDTSKPEVMKQAVCAGADFINDVRALQEPGALEAAAEANVPVCLMHMQGNPENMQSNISYDNIFDEVCEFLSERVSACLDNGIKRENIILDPGFGFGKTQEHNYHLLANLERFHELGYPLLVGISRKTMLHKFLDKKPEDCVIASVVGTSVAIWKGAQIVRVHDVDQMVEATKIIQMIKHNR